MAFSCFIRPQVSRSKYSCSTIAFMLINLFGPIFFATAKIPGMRNGEEGGNNLFKLFWLNFDIKQTTIKTLKLLKSQLKVDG